MFKEKTKVAVEHFQKRFTAPPQCPTNEILVVLNLFLRMIKKEMQQDLMEEMSKEELNRTISSFQKGKSLGPDGFTLEFFLGFYESVKDDLLKVVRES